MDPTDIAGVSQRPWRRVFHDTNGLDIKHTCTNAKGLDLLALSKCRDTGRISTYRGARCRTTSSHCSRAFGNRGCSPHCGSSPSSVGWVQTPALAVCNQIGPRCERRVTRCRRARWGKQSRLAGRSFKTYGRDHGRSDFRYNGLDSCLGFEMSSTTVRFLR